MWHARVGTKKRRKSKNVILTFDTTAVSGRCVLHVQKRVGARKSMVVCECAPEVCLFNNSKSSGLMLVVLTPERGVCDRGNKKGALFGALLL